MHKEEDDDATRSFLIKRKRGECKQPSATIEFIFLPLLHVHVGKAKRVPGTEREKTISRKTCNFDLFSMIGAAYRDRIRTIT